MGLRVPVVIAGLLPLALALSGYTSGCGGAAAPPDPEPIELSARSVSFQFSKSGPLPQPAQVRILSNARDLSAQVVGPTWIRAELASATGPTDLAIVPEGLGALATGPHQTQVRITGRGVLPAFVDVTLIVTD